jgi:hypothetical protein
MGLSHFTFLRGIAMSQNKPDPNVRHLLSILQEMASVSEEILHWGMEGNEPQVRVHVDRMRQLTSDLQEAEDKSKSYFDTRPVAEKIIVSELLEKIDDREKYQSLWQPMAILNPNKNLEY